MPLLAPLQSNDAVLLKNKRAPKNRRQHFFVVAGLIILICLTYSNSVHNSFQFDDLQLTERPNLHLTQLSFHSIGQTFIWTPSDKKIYRPLACLTLGLNYYFGRLDPFGYHLVNIAIHIFTALTVYCFIYLLLGIPGIKPSWFHDHRYELAALTAFLFALHPLQTNVATYIIQRMTSLSALFYMISLCGYLIFRRSILPGAGQNRSTTIRSLALMFLAATASLLSKENSAMLPVIVVSIDYLFFYPISSQRQQKISRFIYALLLLVPLVAAAVLAPNILAQLIDPQKLASSFSHRNFTLYERLLTESRIVFFYLYLILVPRIDLLNLNHDITISTNVLSPPTTLASIIFIGVLLVSSFVFHRKYNLLSFAVIWYFANLAIESTVLPLELMYEHRTYLPGVLIYLLIAGILLFIALKFNSTWIAAFFLGTVLILYGNGTFMRNFVWRTPLTMWESVVENSPGLARAHANYGVRLINMGKNQEALVEIKKALSMDDKNQVESMFNLSKVLRELGRTEEGLAVAKKLYTVHPTNVLSAMAMGNAYVALGNYKEAARYFEHLVHNVSYYIPAIINLGYCQIKTNNPGAAIQTYRKGLQIDPGSEEIVINLAKLYTNQGQKEQALRLLSDFQRNAESRKINTLYRIIESRTPVQTSFTRYDQVAGAPVSKKNAPTNKPERIMHTSQ